MFFHPFFNSKGKREAGTMTLTERLSKRTIPDGAIENISNLVASGKGDKSGNCGVREGATPLRDRTNQGQPEVRLLKPEAPVKVDCNSDAEPIEAHETVELDSEGFVIWADTSSQEQASRPPLEPAEEIRVLRAALGEALEENRRVQTMIGFYLQFVASCTASPGGM